MGMLGIIFIWEKYREIIYEGWRRYNGKNYMGDFEYFADEMRRYVGENDPDYIMPETLTR